MPSLLIQGRRIKYSMIGSGKPVVLVHGSFATSSAWRRVISNLDSERLCTIAVDLPGSGVSDDVPPDSSTILEHESAAVEAVAKRAATEPVHLVGHSHGGVIALAIVLAKRISIRSLTLFEPLPLALLGDTGDTEVLNEVTIFVADYRRAFEAGDPWAVRRVIELWGGPGTFDAMSLAAREAIAAATDLNLRQWEGSLAYHPPLDAFRSIHPPTTLVCGEMAHRISKLMSGRLHELIPQSKVIEIAGAGHFMIHTHSVEAADIIDLATNSALL